MMVAVARRLKALEVENAKLKKLLAVQRQDLAVLNNSGCRKMAGPAVMRDAVAYLRAEPGLSERAGPASRSRGSNDAPLSLSARAGHQAARAVGGTGERAPAVWPPAALLSAALLGRARRDQPGLSALPRDAADTAQAESPAHGGPGAGANAGRGVAHRALVSRDHDCVTAPSAPAPRATTVMPPPRVSRSVQRLVRDRAGPGALRGFRDHRIRSP